MLVWLGTILGPEAMKLPFILASCIIVTNPRYSPGDAPRCVIENAYCLWDTGAQASFILTDRLPADVRDS